MNRRLSCHSLLVCLVLMLSAGCGGGPSQVEQQAIESEVNHLNAIQMAYMEYTGKNDKPPQSPDDLKDYFEDGVDVNSVYTSNRDGQPYVVLWGTDFRQHSGTKPLVIAYEKDGEGGKRLVFTGFGVIEMTESEFRDAAFPPGKQPQ